MGDKSGIEWTDATWNPVVGCSKVSPGCAHCYAETVHKNRMDGRHGYPTFEPWTPANADHNVTLMPDRLEQPLKWTKPRMVFVNSMSDLFHENVPDDYIADVFAVMRQATQHTFQVLTKRPERMHDLLRRKQGNFYGKIRLRQIERQGSVLIDPCRYDGSELPNVWLGVSIENRQFVHRADLLRDIPAAVRFISAEPLLGPLICPGCKGGGSIAVPGGGRACPNLCADGAGASSFGASLNLTGIDWLIVGGESGPKHRPMDEQWVRDLRDSCGDAWIVDGQRVPKRTAFFFKQWGGTNPKTNGRELDGRTWSEMPEVLSA